ncbi:hypothetical protein CQA48_30655, partial [Klebsiella pneumoniae]
DGQYVTEGDLLFTLDDAQPRAALALAQAELKSATSRTGSMLPKATCCLPSTTRSPARRWLWRRPS